MTPTSPARWRPDAPPDKLDALLKLTERYCVVYQTLKSGPPIEVKLNRA
jgi:uncharacterized OsmC-like protein